MHIDGLLSKVTVREGHRTVTVFQPEDTDGRRVLALEMLTSGKGRLMLFEDGKTPDTSEISQLYIEKAADDLVERMVRAMAVFHLGVVSAENKLTVVDVEMLSRGFELGFSDTDNPVWIRLSSAMNVVIQKPIKNGLPSHMSNQVSMTCIIPERSHLQYNCENMATAFLTLEKNTPFKVKQSGDPEEMITMDIVDAATVVYH